MKIAFFEVEKWQEKYLKSKLKGELQFFKGHLTSNVTKIKDVEVLCVFVYSNVTKEILDKLDNLKIICTMSTGFDHIYLEACKEKGIKVFNCSTYAENTVAEHTFSMILGLSRKLVDGNERVMKGNMSLDGLRGKDLKNKTLGLIGAGKIGLNVIKMAKGFGMNVIVYDIVKNKNYKYVSLDTLLKKSDIVSLHCPLTKDNEHLINSKNLKKMKKGSMIINTARGGLVDTIAVADAIKKGKLGGVGLDVLENEKEVKKGFKGSSKLLRAERYLLKQDHVIITAHNAFNSEESVYRLLDETIQNIKGKGRCLSC
ncbi:MAG: hydroxyacid dehydrogenase [Nanoarchaeota archaeon]|nr:hydroxyacid dehydrogenase [Nanoarchaeota archaeon]|tara:strand:- start:1046 stop:1984 length:939 start_codon:yes stop_codon:yes gene_type:complete